MIQSVVHIVDDNSWGGVNRLLNCLAVAGDSKANDDHRIMRLQRGVRKAPLIQADVIVSHMSICWKNIPFFSSLRAAHPETTLIHVEHSYSERFVALKVENRDRFEDLVRLTMGLFDKIIAVSEPQASWLRRRSYANRDQLVTISSCVSLAAFRAVANRRPLGPVTIGAIGRLHDQKGFDLLVDAFVSQPKSDQKLLVIGEGADREILQRKANGHAGIIFLPYTSEPAEAMALCDVVAMPSRWEPYGLVALEAMAAKRPVFCSRVDGLKQHISTGAIEVAENTVAGWGNVLSQLPTRQDIAQLPRGSGHLTAENTFMNSWNALIRDVTLVNAENQKAA
jgi:D-inositol-3-phosphate glycosyltransferase